MLKAFFQKYGFFWPAFFCLTFGTLVFCLLFPYVPGNDTLFHVARIDGLANHFAAGGGYPCRLYESFCDGYGYAAPLFYCDLFLIPFALLHLAGASLTVCYAALVFSLGVLTFGMMWGMSGWFGLRGRERLICTSFYLLVPSFSTNLLTWGQIGSTFGMAFTPCVLFPLIVLILEDKISTKRMWSTTIWLTFGMTMLICSHLVSSCLLILFALALCLFRVLFLIKHWKRILCLALSAVLTVFVTAWYWIPFLEQQSMTDLVGFSADTSTYWKTLAIRPIGLFFSYTICKTMLAPLLGSYATIPVGMVECWGWILVPLAIGIWRDHLLRKAWHARLWVKVSVVTLVLTSIFFSSHTLLVWTAPFLSWMQFPMRLYIICLPLLSLLVAAWLTRHASDGMRRFFAMGVAIALVCALTNTFGRYALAWMGERETIAEASLHIGGGYEYLPCAWEKEVKARGENPMYMWQEPTDSTNYGPYCATIERTDATTLVPRWYYYGYAATLNGEPCAVRESKNGCVEVQTDGKTGELKVWYAGTPLQRISAWVSFLSLVGILLVSVAVWGWRRCKA